ncbi:MAG: hypothetical protein ACXWHZ_16745 [Usitatibacter sp.]
MEPRLTPEKTKPANCARKARFHRLEALLRRAAHVLVGLGALLENREQHRLAVRVARGAQQLDRRKTAVLVGALQVEVRRDHRERGLDAGIRFLREGFLHERRHRRLGASGELLGRGGARFPVGGDQPQRGERAFELAPQAIVDHDVLAARRHGHHRGSGEGIGRRLAFHDQHLLAGRLHLAVGQGLEQHHGLRIVGSDQGRDRRDLLVALAKCEPRDGRGIERGERVGGEQAERQEGRAQHPGHGQGP